MDARPRSPAHYVESPSTSGVADPASAPSTDRGTSRRLLPVLPLVGLALLLGCASGGVAQDASADVDTTARIVLPESAADPMIDPAWEGLRVVTAPQDEEEESVLTVTGQAEVEAAPDRARIQLAVETEGESAAEAGDLNAALMTQVMSAMRSAGEDADGFRLETFGYSLSPRYGAVRADRSREIVGYTARNTLEVTVDEVDRVGGLIDAALGAGSNRVSSLTFEVQDPEPYRHEAMREAIRSARAEAEVMAAALGMELGTPVEVQGGANVPPPRPLRAFADAVEMSAAQAPTPVEAGMQSISANVTIRFRLEPGG